jgi:hypothetical protein
LLAAIGRHNSHAQNVSVCGQSNFIYQNTLTPAGGFTSQAAGIVTVQTGQGDCIETATVNTDVEFTELPCNCVVDCHYYLYGPITYTLPSNTQFCIAGPIIIPGGSTINFDLSDFRIYPDVTILVEPNATLNIRGSHLFACDDLWNGIVVQPGGVLNIVSSVSIAGVAVQNPSISPEEQISEKTSLIEGAKVAVDILSYTLTGSPFNILTAEAATFNQNIVGIRIGNYQKNQIAYPFKINNCLFTSRKIPYGALSWPLTNAIKNSLSGNTHTLLTPYLDNSAFPPMAINGGTNNYGFPTNGLVLNHVGLTVFDASGAVSAFHEISIGQAGSENFNCFDHLQEDISAKNSNLTVINSVFQYGVMDSWGLSGAKAIRAISDMDIDGERTAINRIQILNGAPGGNSTNRFYEKSAAADIFGYFSTNIRFAQVRSYANDYSNFNLGNPLIGNLGFNVQTNRFQNINLENNSIYNIKNAMMVALDVGFIMVGSAYTHVKQVGNITAANNYVNRGSKPGSPYINIGLSIADPFSSYAPQAINPVYVTAYNNNFTEVHNGIDVKNISYCPVSLLTNTVNMVNEPASIMNPQPTQIGINTEQLLKQTSIYSNKVSGPATYSAGVKAISTAMNQLLSVKCNSTSYTQYGLNFNGSQPQTAVEDNVMAEHRYGLSLTNTAVIGTQGSSVNPTNNQWLGSWPSFSAYKTMNYDAQSSAQSSKIYATWNNGSLDPNLSAYTSFGGPLDIYYHDNTPSNILNTIQPAIFIPPGCRLGGVNPINPNLNLAMQLQLMENIVTNAVPGGSIAATTRFIAKNGVYRAIKSNPSYTLASAILAGFYSNAQSSFMALICKIEDTLSAGNLPAASAMLQSLTPANFVETNYKNFYNIYLSTKDSTYSNTDSLNLANLCYLCPYTNGGVVYQARALYHNLYNCYKTYNDNCGNNNINNRVAPPRFAKDEVNSGYRYVDIQSKLFPNPNPGEFEIYISDPDEKMPVEVKIYDMAGREVFDAGRKLPQAGGHFRVKTDLNNGTFVVKAKFSNGKINVHKLVITK